MPSFFSFFLVGHGITEQILKYLRGHKIHNNKWNLAWLKFSSTLLLAPYLNMHRLNYLFFPRCNKVSFKWRYIGWIQCSCHSVQGGASRVDGELAAQKVCSGGQLKGYIRPWLPHFIPTSQSSIGIILSTGPSTPFYTSPFPLHTLQQLEHATIAPSLRAAHKSSPNPNSLPTPIAGQPVALPPFGRATSQHYQLSPHYVEWLFFLLHDRCSSFISPRSKWGSQHALQSSLGAQAASKRWGVHCWPIAPPKEILHRVSEWPGRT